MPCLVCFITLLLGQPPSDHLHPEDGDDGIVIIDPDTP